MINKQKQLTQLIWAFWIMITIWGCIYALTNSDVAIIYYHAGQHWLHTQPLYDSIGTQFIYLPQSALFYTPLSALPFPVSVCIWRFISILLFAYSLYKLIDLINIKKTNWVFIITSCITIPLCITMARNGQMHLMIMSLMFFAAIAMHQGKWWQAAFLLAAAVAVKPTAIIVFLLFGVIFPKLWGRIIIASIVLLLIPFLAQSPHYVMAQYQAFIHSFGAISRLSGTLPKHWAQGFSVIQFFTTAHFSALAQMIIRFIFAIITLGLCAYAKRKFSLKEAIIFIFTLGIIYLMLFNPRTENNDYVMLMPFVGIAFAKAIYNNNRFGIISLAIISALFIFNHPLATLFTPHCGIWLKPTACILFAIYTLLGFRIKNVTTHPVRHPAT